MSEIDERIKKIHYVIGQSHKNVRLVAATKDQSPEKILDAMNSGIHIFGENYVQEFLSKWNVIGSKAEWHFMGHLQTNKVKYIIDKVSMIQSVDSLKLFNAIHDETQKINRKIPVLLEINIGEEKTKTGILPKDVFSFMKSLPGSSQVEICGYMCIPPYLSNPEDVRPFFKKMKSLQEKMQAEFPKLHLKELSMGMSHDYPIAIEEGATMIRIGEGIFGKRH